MEVVIFSSFFSLYSSPTLPFFFFGNKASAVGLIFLIYTLFIDRLFFIVILCCSKTLTFFFFRQTPPFSLCCSKALTLFFFLQTPPFYFFFNCKVKFFLFSCLYFLPFSLCCSKRLALLLLFTSLFQFGFHTENFPDFIKPSIIGNVCR